LQTDIWLLELIIFPVFLHSAVYICCCCKVLCWHCNSPTWMLCSAKMHWPFKRGVPRKTDWRNMC